MEHETATHFLRDSVVMLGFALGFVLLFRRLGLGATLGYLVAGAIIGPQVLGLTGEAEGKIAIAELGIVLLLFVVGLELAPARLWRMKKEIFGLGLAQVLLCGVALTGAIGLTTGFSWPAAIALGMPLALSSTAQVLPMLQSAGRLRTPFGERAFSILLFQDLSLIPMITVVAALSRNPADQAGPPGWQFMLMTIAAIAGLILAGRFVIRPLFRLIGGLGEREMFIVAALFTVAASAAVMELLGLSTALGAFIAGVMLADTPYRHELETDVEPFRSILLGLFFLAVGMMLDLGAIAERPFFVLIAAIGLIAIKTAIIAGLGLLLGMGGRTSLALGLLLSQGGEFGFVLFAQAQQGLLIEPEAASLFGAVVTISMAATPFLMMLSRPLRRPPESKERREGPRSDGAAVLVVGYGRFGQTVAQMMIASDIQVTLIDTDTEMIDVASEFGSKVYFGDGTRIDLLRQAGAAEAAAICFCLDGKQIDRELLEAVREAFPQARVFLRAYDRRTLIDLRDAPHDYAVREVMESALQMGRAALEALGDSQQDIDEAEDHYRKTDLERLDAQREAGDYRAARDMVIRQNARPKRTTS
ncbi:Glutathione-regulated potassium-efflux system protein KefC [Tsuneonella dongtanensis]|uniref:Glutathione-regulated potassium-efflux system protein KefC n=1 Tax=Tsuneonella dongtanensis TaxID=692370 RepID=A0A1B2A9I4_9SPHN|nr:cation:proton antiporter [Tsuneonella dongtanensis]ANY18715.1 Glutathione-regulated potassium-efflux system protein KefC [Tsuneonella dongtanensis]